MSLFHELFRYLNPIKENNFVRDFREHVIISFNIFVLKLPKFLKKNDTIKNVWIFEREKTSTRFAKKWHVTKTVLPPVYNFWINLVPSFDI